MAQPAIGSTPDAQPHQSSYWPMADTAERLLREAPEAEQPLARLVKLGPAALSTPELLQLVLDGKGDPLLSFRLLEKWPALSEMTHASSRDLRQIPGMTLIRVARLQAALELGKRALAEPSLERPIVRSPADAAALLLPEMQGLAQEQMRVMLLNTRNGVLGIPMIYQGSIHTTVIRVGELFREAIKYNAAAILVAHNHPSGGIPTPSPEDVAVTREIVQSGQLLDVDVIDHILIGDGGHWVSMKERGLGF